MLPLIAERQITVTVHSLLVATVEAEPLIAAPAAVDSVGHRNARIVGRDPKKMKRLHRDLAADTLVICG